MINKLITLLFILFLSAESAFPRDITITIHLRGVYESKISLLPLTGPNAMKPVAVVEGVKKDVKTSFIVPAENLPGEAVIRFENKDNAGSSPYPCEKRIIINNQNIELWVNPKYCSNPDSSWFQKEERENTVFRSFHQENNRQAKILGLLQDFLLNYDNTQSGFYKKGIREYEKRRKKYNDWIAEQIIEHNELFVSSFFGFYHTPQVNWKGTEADRKRSLRDNYHEGVNFNDTLILNTASMKEWMDGYVNLFSELATSIRLRDSVFTMAGKNAIEKAKMGHPKVYGWMVDYFFNGYESFNIEKGIRMLEPYMKDPRCLTGKRNEINRRLEGLETLIPGSIAPNIMLETGSIPFELYEYGTDKNYLLLLFWSADCNHCIESIKSLYIWHRDPKIQQLLNIAAISLDETDSEVQVWKKMTGDLKGWTHLRAKEGLRSKVAVDYYILGVPVMILLDAKTREIIALPENTKELNEYLRI